MVIIFRTPKRTLLYYDFAKPHEKVNFARVIFSEFCREREYVKANFALLSKMNADLPDIQPGANNKHETRDKLSIISK